MYQSIFHEYKTGTIYLRDDKEGWLQFKYEPTYYERVKEKTPDSLPVLTGGWAVPTKTYDKDDPNLLEKDINKELVVLRDLYYKDEDGPSTGHNIVYLDIETKMGGALTIDYIKAAPMPMTSIAIIDSLTKQKTCFIVDETKQIKESIDGNKIVIPCANEEELCLKFLNKWEEIDPTIVATWNGQWFDIPYLYFRMCSVIGLDKTLKLSPIRKISVADWNPREVIVKLGGINHLDYMLLHKKYIMKEEPSYKLKDIAKKYTKLEKIEYEGNLNQLFKDDKVKFIDYNLRDVEILEALEDKLKFINLTVMMCHICSIPYESVYHNTVLNEGAILKYLKRNNIIAPNKPTTHNPLLKGEEKTYAGGFIKEPNPGLYHDCIDLDFTSLYPSIIKSLNLGIETLVGRIYNYNNTNYFEMTKDNKIKIKANYNQDNTLVKLKLRDPEEILKIERLNKEKYVLESTEIKIGDLINIIEKEKYTISASGAMFRTDVRSITAKILEEWFEKREFYRAKKKLAGKQEDWVNYKLYDLFQHSFKILQNAMYGTFAKNGWRFTDGHIICSAAITNTGQVLTKESIVFNNKRLSKELNEENGDYVIISDTDSMYFELGKILKHRYGNNLEDKDKKILEIASEIQNESNKHLNELSKDLFNIDSTKHYFQLKQEVIASSIIVTGKRRYGMFITNKEGVNISPDHEDALDLKGLEVMKSNMNPLFKTFGEQLIKDILFGKPKNEIDIDIINFHKSLKNVDPKMIGKPTGVSFIEKCIKRSPQPGEIFSEFNINTKENSRAAIVYNDLLKFKKLNKKYESIIEGDKIFVLNLKDNPYKINVIGIPNSKIPEDIENFIKEFIDVASIFESMILNKIKELYIDLSWDFPSLNPKINRYFSF